MNFIGFAFQGNTGSTGSMWTMILLYGLIIAVFYFILIRPQSKQKKRHHRRHHRPCGQHQG